MRLWMIEYLLECLVILNEEIVKSFENREL